MKSPIFFSILCVAFIFVNLQAAAGSAGNAHTPATVKNTVVAGRPVVILRGERPNVRIELGRAMGNQVVDVSIVRGHQVPSLAKVNVYATTVRMKADSKGVVDFSKRAPLDGWQYTDAQGNSAVSKQVDVWGPLWNMSTTKKSNLPAALISDPAQMAQINKLSLETLSTTRFKSEY